jgi:hypothetical protein
MEWTTVWVSTKPLITEEIWPGQGLNPGLPNDTPVLYPLPHKLMLIVTRWLYVNISNAHLPNEDIPNEDISKIDISNEDIPNKDISNRAISQIG